jgi:hypothetical protein
MKPKLTHEFKPMVTVLATGEIIGNIREAQAAFEQRAENLRAEIRDAEIKAEMEARRIKAEQAAREREQTEKKNNSIQAQIKRLTAGATEPNKYASYEQKAEYWNPVIREFKSQGMNDQAICKLLKIHIKVIGEAMKLTPQEAPKPRASLKLNFDGIKPHRMASFEVKREYYGPEIMRLYRGHVPIKEIAQQVHLNSGTVTKIIRAS